MGRKSALCQRLVGGIGKVCHGVEQCPVKVEYYELFFHLVSCLKLLMASITAWASSMLIVGPIGSESMVLCIRSVMGSGRCANSR